MKPAAPSEAARELESLEAAFARIRILHQVAQGPAADRAIIERSRQGRARPGQILASLVHRDLLRAKTNPASSARQYFLTSKGRRLLAIASKHLRQLPKRTTTRA